jgi:hypothetical protein
MELDAVEEGVFVNRAGVGGAPTKGLAVRLAGASEILVRDRREWQQVDIVDPNRHGTAPIDAPDLDLWLRPQPVGDRDSSVRNAIAEIRAELHVLIVADGEWSVHPIRQSGAQNDLTGPVCYSGQMG